jgi:putative mRNA 3-end processing factor
VLTISLFRYSLFCVNIKIRVLSQSLVTKELSATSVTFSESGITVYSNGRKILLDPNRGIDCDLVFVSHAHTDHLIRSCKKILSSRKTKTLTSRETSMIAYARGFRIDDVTQEYDGFQLVNTGHILGSKGLLIGDDLYYTGDISVRERAFMKPAFIPKADTLIIESTFGRPEYVFPDLREVIDRTNRIISEMYSRGVPVILLGYPLGKAQLLTELFSHWEPLYVDDSIYRMNCLYKDLGVSLKESMQVSLAEKTGLLMRQKPWLMISPLGRSKTTWLLDIKEKYGAITIGFSGWAVNHKYRCFMGTDYAMPISDHCDFQELIDVVKLCNAKKIYTFHGYSSDFAQSLRKMGFDAEPIQQKRKRQVKKDRSSRFPDYSLDDYIKK